jgi:putative N6-adenine-specific DNA methylase
MTFDCFAACAPGIETWVAAELRALCPADRPTRGTHSGTPSPSGQRSPKESRGEEPLSPQIDVRWSPDDPSNPAGGIPFHCNQAGLAHALVGSGLAARILVRVCEFSVRHLNELEKRVAELDWHQWLVPGVPRSLRVATRKSKLYHTGAIEERVARGIRRALQERQDLAPQQNHGGPHVGADETEEGLESAQACVAVRLDRDRCTISLDASGTPLHRRGYRINPHRAPLREDLARALLVASGWDRHMPLLDPCCGSGTLIVEAGILAASWPPGWLRRFSIEHTRILDKQFIENVKKTRLSWGRALLDAGPSIQLFGGDRDPAAIQAAQQNWERWPWTGATVTNGGTVSVLAPASLSLDLRVCELRDWRLKKRPLMIVTNPPWGDRIADPSSLWSIYQGLGELRRRSAEGSRLGLLTSQREFAYRTGIPLGSMFLTDAGGTKVNFFLEGQKYLPQTVAEQVPGS